MKKVFFVGINRKVMYEKEALLGKSLTTTLHNGDIFDLRTLEKKTGEKYILPDFFKGCGEEEYVYFSPRFEDEEFVLVKGEGVSCETALFSKEGAIWRGRYSYFLFEAGKCIRLEKWEFLEEGEEWKGLEIF